MLSCAQGVDPKNSEVVSLDQLKVYVYGPIGYYSTQFKGVFYAGSDNEFDYIAINHRDKIAKMLRVRRGELAIKDRVPIEFKSEKWVNVTQEFPFPASVPSSR